MIFETPDDAKTQAYKALSSMEESKIFRLLIIDDIVKKPVTVGFGRCEEVYREVFGELKIRPTVSSCWRKADNGLRDDSPAELELACKVAAARITQIQSDMVLKSVFGTCEVKPDPINIFVDDRKKRRI